MNALIYGNCQGTPLSEYLLSYPPFIEKYNSIDVIAVYTMGDKTLDDINIGKYDLIISHIIQDWYGNGQLGLSTLRKKIKSTAILIVIPNLYYSGYHPDLTYLIKYDGSHHAEFGYPHHDINFIYEFLMTKNNSEELINPKIYLDDVNFIETNSNKSIKQLEIRDKDCDIKMAEYLKKHYQKRKCFYTINHCTPDMIKEISSRLLNYLGYSNTYSEISCKTHLDNDIFLISKRTTEILKLDFLTDVNNYRVSGKDYTSDEYKETMMKYYEYLYNKSPFILENTLKIWLEKAIIISS